MRSHFAAACVSAQGISKQRVTILLGLKLPRYSDSQHLLGSTKQTEGRAGGKNKATPNEEITEISSSCDSAGESRYSHDDR